MLFQLADEWDELHTQYVEHISHHQSDTPIHVFSTSPTPPASRTTSASQPHLHNIPHPDIQRTPSEVLSSSGGSYTTTHSQDDVVGIGGSFAPNPPTKLSSQSQSHPNIHSLGTTSNSHTDTTDMGTRLTLTNSSDSHTETITPPTDIEAQTTSPRSYVNFDIDELRNESSRDRRLRSLSPLELSIERELERAHASQGSETANSDSSKGERDDAEELHPYANWQFEKMNEKQQRAPSSASNTIPLLNGASLSGRQDIATHKTPTHKSTRGSTSASPKRSLKPPSPFKLQNLSDLTSLGTSSSATSTDQSSRVTEEEPPPKSVHSSGNNAKGQVKLGKALSTSKLHDVSSTDSSSSGLPSTSSHSTRNIDQLLPSQLNLGGGGSGKPRSYTTSFNLSKKKPILPPAPVGKRVPFKPHLGKKSASKVVEEAIDERSEMVLENSDELERSFEKKTGPGSGSSVKLSSSKSFHMGSERGVTGTAVKPARQSSPSSELMRKLSLRRQRLEQQLGTTVPTPGSDSSSRRTSTSSTQSEFVCSYNLKRSQEDEPSTVEVELRSKEEATLAKYGIMEDIEGGSYEI